MTARQRHTTDSISGVDAPVSDCRHPPSRHHRTSPSTLPDGGSTSIGWSGILAHEVPAVWPGVKPFIEKALVRAAGEYEAADILTALLERQMQLWMVHDDRLRAVVVTEVHTFPRKKFATVVLMAGDSLSEWINLFDDVLARWARERGCTEVRGFCRPGLERVLDWKRQYVVLGKEI